MAGSQLCCALGILYIILYVHAYLLCYVPLSFHLDILLYIIICYLLFIVFAIFSFI